MWVDKNGNFYEGDLQPGDRAATPEEVVAHNAAANAAVMATYLNNFRRNEREPFLNRIAGIGLAAAHEGNTVVLDSVIAVRQGLLDMTTAPTVVAATNLVELKAAMKAIYNALLAGVPPEVKAAFKEVDQ